jgi:hypothetical protein
MALSAAGLHQLDYQPRRVQVKIGYPAAPFELGGKQYFGTLPRKAFYVFFKIVHHETQVLDALPFFLQEFLVRRFPVYGLYQFKLHAADLCRLNRYSLAGDKRLAAVRFPGIGR